MPMWLPSQQGKSREASVGETSLPPPPGILGSKSAVSKKCNMMTSGSPSAKGGGGADVLNQDPQLNDESYKATDHKHSDSKTPGWPARSRGAPNWARDYCLEI